MKILYVFGSATAARSWSMHGHVSPVCAIHGGLAHPPKVTTPDGGTIDTAVIYDRESMRALQGNFYDAVICHPSFYHVLKSQQLEWDEFVRLCLLKRQ